MPLTEIANDSASVASVRHVDFMIPLVLAATATLRRPSSGWNTPTP